MYGINIQYCHYQVSTIGGPHDVGELSFESKNSFSRMLITLHRYELQHISFTQKKYDHDVVDDFNIIRI